MTLKCPRYPQNSPLAPTKIGPGLRPQRRTGNRGSKGCDQDEGEGLGPRERAQPQGTRSGWCIGLGWSRNKPAVGWAGRDPSTLSRHRTDRQEAQQGWGRAR